jgi:hypothetical protein
MEAMKLAAQKWGTFTDKDKKKYNFMHDQDVKRYEKQLQDLNKNGFFIMDDGTKSNDHIAKIKKKRSKSSAKDDSESENEKPVKIKAVKVKK